MKMRRVLQKKSLKMLFDSNFYLNLTSKTKPKKKKKYIRFFAKISYLEDLSNTYAESHCSSTKKKIVEGDDKIID
jgi:hypothetical protein